MEFTTYARARLWTGIVGVGTIVLLATALLAFEVPTLLLEGRGGTLGADAVLLFTVLAIGAFVVLPFDILGGFKLPSRFGRPVLTARRFAAAWFRGVLVLLTVSTVNGVVLLAAGRAGGRPAALAGFVTISLLMVVLQEPIARLVGGLRRVPSNRIAKLTTDTRRIVLLHGTDPGFSGGFTGLSAKLVLPEHWFRLLKPRELSLLLERRKHILRSGAWRRALTLAVTWNAFGFLIASLLPSAGVGSVSELVTTILGFTLWTFFGLLVLPTPSRRATLSVDSVVAPDEPSRELLGEAVKVLDDLQDGEPERSPGLETIFHPVPSVANRMRALLEPVSRSRGAWHLARTALYLSYAGVSLLPRAVHCNVGRPELWVYLPTDG
ncbi:MAG: hypothetical protein ACI835_005308 [Planctomycetota bacterium]|jgi:hypothetical protein